MHSAIADSCFCSLSLSLTLCLFHTWSPWHSCPYGKRFLTLSSYNLYAYVSDKCNAFFIFGWIRVSLTSAPNFVYTNTHTHIFTAATFHLILFTARPIPGYKMHNHLDGRRTFAQSCPNLSNGNVCMHFCRWWSRDRTEPKARARQMDGKRQRDEETERKREGRKVQATK